MLGIHELWLFVLSGVLLNITPGPDTVYVIGRGMQSVSYTHLTLPTILLV